MILTDPCPIVHLRRRPISSPRERGTSLPTCSLGRMSTAFSMATDRGRIRRHAGGVSGLKAGHHSGLEVGMNTVHFIANRPTSPVSHGNGHVWL